MPFRPPARLCSHTPRIADAGCALSALVRSVGDFRCQTRSQGCWTERIARAMRDSSPSGPCASPPVTSAMRAHCAISRPHCVRNARLPPNLIVAARVSDGNTVDSANCLMNMCVDQQSAAQRPSNILKTAPTFAARTPNLPHCIRRTRIAASPCSPMRREQRAANHSLRDSAIFGNQTEH